MGGSVARILMVEDDAELASLISEYLSETGLTVEVESDGAQAENAVKRFAPDLIILDVMLPNKDGLEICRDIRATFKGPILVLTARGAEDEKVQGLQAGADDYVTKPFGSRELLARIEALGRRANTSPEPPQTIETDGCRIDIGRLVANRDDRKGMLTAREANILRWLHEHRTRAVSRAELLTEVWGASAEQQTRTVDMTIANLRQKIEADPSNPRIVVTVKGIGYAWGPE